MSLLIPLIPGLVALFAVVLFVRGLRLLRSDSIEGLEVQDLVLLRGEQRSAQRGYGPLERLAARLVPTLRNSLSPAVLKWLQRQVDLAGRGGATSLDAVLRKIAMWLIIAAPAMFLFLLQLNIIGIAASVSVVLIMPLAGLSRERRLRQERLDRDLPDFLDILSVTVSAGVGFRPALARVAERYGGPLAEEMTLTLYQIANGASRRQAFTDLRKRNESEALAQFVTAFLQAEELGAPLAETLKQIADDMRRASFQQMRRRAAQTAPRVTLVTSLVLVPGALILIIVGMWIGSGIDLGDMFGGLSG